MKYNIIYADPPLQYNNKMISHNGNNSSPDIHYNTMKFDDICNMNIKSICEKDCALFIWSSSCYIDGVIKIMKAWGFTYKTIAFTWIKQSKNNIPVKLMGHWTLSSCDFVLIGTKGTMKKYLNKKNTEQLVFAQRTRHSEKPKEVIKRITEMFIDIPKIELFARNETPGWDVFGDQVNNSIKL
jgi:N6-adenosine-specific RNA methylase IME4